VELARDLNLLAAVVIAIAGIAGALVLRGLVMKLLALGVGLLVAAYLAGLIHF
jgi:hypothetical protein